MLLLISDANILIDMEAGELLERLFQLPLQFAIPDVLYREEIEPGTPGLEDLGLRVLEVTGEYVRYAFELRGKYGPAPSMNDYLALALARQKGCPLLTGDQALRNAAVAEDIEVRGTVWLLQEMVRGQLISVTEGHAALARMKDARRRLPWPDAERMLNGLRDSS